MVREHRPQVVITDLVMPKMSGLEVLDRIVEFDPGIDVILMTAHYSTESAVDAIKRGASDYLNKPVNICRPADTRKGVDRTGRTQIERRRYGRGNYRQQPGNVVPVFEDSPDCAALSHRLDHRRYRHRQRSSGSNSVQAKSRREGQFCCLELFSSGGNAL